MAIQYIDSEMMEVEGKRVIARFDFNVPLDKSTGKITDTTRLDRALPTIQYILEKKPKNLILMSHLGRPKGEAKAELSLEPVATYLAEKLGEDVILTESCVDRAIKPLLDLPKTRIVLLQNLRFHPEEKNNDPEFARKLASYADVYVNDAFGTAHRKHASTYGIMAYFKKTSFAGFLMKSEIEALSHVVNSPKSPFSAIVGGAKVSDKIKIIDALLANVDHLLIGGAMAYPFLKAKGFEVGSSLCSDEDVALAKNILGQPIARRIVLPKDHLIASNPDSAPSITEDQNIPEGQMGLDIGPQTIELFNEKLKSSKTVLWNGPMGFFEKESFAKGTFAMARTLSDLKDAFTLIGGGDSVSAVNQSGLADKMSHVSTGGGASLEFIENGTLPGVQALKFGLD
ncbi:MAG: phosphoglycerate kinase [Halobacteriovoraceae bacterium]|nr:phosphoglycerate kinase [Halobacteriovoraceae bacterium]